MNPQQDQKYQQQQMVDAFKNANFFGDSQQQQQQNPGVNPYGDSW